MNRVLLVLLSALLLCSCGGGEVDNPFIYQNTFGPGAASDIHVTPDTGIVACGSVSGSPFVVRLSHDRSSIVPYTSSSTGLFSSVIPERTSCIVGGVSDGKMLLSKISDQGSLVWDTTITVAYSIDNTSLCKLSTGDFVAVGSSEVDSLSDEIKGLVFVKFDSDGNILVNESFVESASLHCKGVASDGNDNIYLALTRCAVNQKSKAMVAKFNNSFQKLWEEELYNNPRFGSSSSDIIVGDGGAVFVTGKTETYRDDKSVDNSFIASLQSSNGFSVWKSYREYANTGVAILQNSIGNVMILNANCFVVCLADPVDGADQGLIRLFDACDSQNTTAIGSAADRYHDDNLLVAGSNGGSFFIAIKSTENVVPY